MKHDPSLFCKKRKWILSLLSLIALHSIAWAWKAGDPVVTLDDWVEVFSQSAEMSESAKLLFLKKGPDVVPIITRKIHESLNEDVTQGNSNDSGPVNNPSARNSNVAHQLGLINLEMVALSNFQVDKQTRDKALDALYAELGSTHAVCRSDAMSVVSFLDPKNSVDRILVLLEDPDILNRVTAADILAQIGNVETADKISALLERRGNGMSKEQKEKDFSFKSGRDAVDALRKKAAHRQF